jgi:trehalose 6-phosphate synthase
MSLLLHISKSLRLGLITAGVVGLALGAMAWYQIEQERRLDMEDIERRAHELVRQLTFPTMEALDYPDELMRQRLGPQLEGYGRLLGFGIFRADGKLAAAPKAVADYANALKAPVAKVLRLGEEITFSFHDHGPLTHALAMPLRGSNHSVKGALVVLHDLAYMDDRVTARLVYFGFWILVLAMLLLTVVAGLTWFAYDRPLRNLAQWMRRLRVENTVESPPPNLPGNFLHSESDRLAASLRAARLVGLEESRAQVRAENVWTRERLRHHAIDCLGEGQQLVVVSNREPYMHRLVDGKPQAIIPAGGLVTALDPVLQACGGLWVAHGGGDADRQTADARGRLTVPPGDSRYTLRRVWLSREEEQGYYYGFANQGLWPLCHIAHERPIFRSPDWEYYVQVNQRFAEAVLKEIGDGDGVVLVQDYQLALVPSLLKQARPDLRIGIFWHIPWPNPEVFQICPWRAEILRGMLGADLIGFHLQQYCNNFLSTVDSTVESRLDWDHFDVEWQGHSSMVRPFPISVQPWNERDANHEGLAKRIAEIKAQNEIEGVAIAIGVDRVDYTKGLPERFRAIGRFFEKYPQWRERITFVQLGAPSRTHIRRYREHIAELEALADEVNWRHATDTWKPLRFQVAHHNAATVHAYLAMARVCVVSSLHDGMNLVAKEYVAAQESGDGVLVISQFAGAARELYDGIVINPYDTEQFADALYAAVEMPDDERRPRMANMRRQVEENNIYRWAASFLTELSAARIGKLEGTPTVPELKVASGG